MEGSADLTLALGGQQAHLALAATLSAGAAETHVRARITPFVPSALAQSAPSLAALAALDAPVSGEAAVDLDRHLGFRDVRFDLHAGAGNAQIGKSAVPFVDAVLVGSATPDAVNVRTLRVTLRGRATSSDTHLETHGTVQLGTDRISADLSADLDQVAFADLPVLARRSWRQCA